MIIIKHIYYGAFINRSINKSLMMPRSRERQLQ